MVDLTNTFPPEFWWGTGNSSNQCEGAAPASDWLKWEQSGHAPRSGDGNGFATRYEEDFELLRNIGLDHFRLSLEWARLEPEQGHYDRAEIERYRAILQAGCAAGLNMWVTAHHFTLPYWFSDMGGFGDGHARNYLWVKHIEFLAETFGDLVFGWKPINEPHAFALCGWLLGIHPPGLADVSLAAHMLVSTHLANHLAWKTLRGGQQPVVTIHNLSPTFPRSDCDADINAAKLLNGLSFDMWIDTIRDGVLRVPNIPGMDIPEAISDPEFVDAFDVIGFSYYNTMSVQASPDLEMMGGVIPGPYPLDGDVGPLGYVPWGGGLETVLNKLHHELPGKPLLISEYGIGTTDDSRRCDHIVEGVGIAAKALERGIDLRGFFHWTGVDNYEWSYGYDVPFGLIDADRNLRGSATVMGTLAREGSAT